MPPFSPGSKDAGYKGGGGSHFSPQSQQSDTDMPLLDQGDMVSYACVSQTFICHPVLHLKPFQQLLQVSKRQCRLHGDSVVAVSLTVILLLFSPLCSACHCFLSQGKTEYTYSQPGTIAQGPHRSSSPFIIHFLYIYKTIIIEHLYYVSILHHIYYTVIEFNNYFNNDPHDHFTFPYLF